MEKNTLYINLFGGPGTGKSTLCGAIFTELKRRGIDCEMALEYAKDLVWEKSFEKIKNQQYIFGKQHNRLFRLHNQLHVVITDSPLINSIVYYTGNNPYFGKNVLWEFNQLNSLNYYLNRSFEYIENGRMQTLDEAIQVDITYKILLNDNNIPYYDVMSGLESINQIVNDILKKLEFQKEIVPLV